MSKRYTYADYLTWFDEKRRELVDGFIRMLAAPSRAHQKVSSRINQKLLLIVEEHKGNCEVYYAPFDVRLPKNGEKDDKDIYTVVQPDICVVCDLSKLNDKGCLGAPDMIIEIQSPSSGTYDLIKKRELYERSGVREYWIVYPRGGVEIYLLQPNGKYGESKTYWPSDKAPIGIFNNYKLDLNTIFH
jgi:Uma2 family endonuclease